jgi:hypothetical protein
MYLCAFILAVGSSGIYVKDFKFSFDDTVNRINMTDGI